MYCIKYHSRDGEEISKESWTIHVLNNFFLVTREFVMPPLITIHYLITIEFFFFFKSLLPTITKFKLVLPTSLDVNSKNKSRETNIRTP